MSVVGLTDSYRRVFLAYFHWKRWKQLEARPRSPLRLRASIAPTTRRSPILLTSDKLLQFVVAVGPKHTT